MSITEDIIRDHVRKANKKFNKAHNGKYEIIKKLYFIHYTYIVDGFVFITNI